jgi:hypothetical protein
MYKLAHDHDLRVFFRLGPSAMMQAASDSALVFGRLDPSARQSPCTGGLPAYMEGACFVFAEPALMSAVRRQSSVYVHSKEGTAVAGAGTCRPETLSVSCEACR